MFVTTVNDQSLKDKLKARLFALVRHIREEKNQEIKAYLPFYESEVINDVVDFFP